jgi:uncharacterized LabA/DUF88 family protein
MSELCYVDNSNVFIEGKRVSAVRKGMASDIWQAHDYGILDNSYRLSFGKLYEFILGDDKQQVKRAALFGSRPPQNDELWSIAERAGFEVTVFDRNRANKEKKIDTNIAYLMGKDAQRLADKAADTITLVAGDSDYAAVISDLVSDGFRVPVVFWAHAARELKEAATRFFELDRHLEFLSVQ